MRSVSLVFLHRFEKLFRHWTAAEQTLQPERLKVFALSNVGPSQLALLNEAISGWAWLWTVLGWVLGFKKPSNQVRPSCFVNSSITAQSFGRYVNIWRYFSGIIVVQRAEYKKCEMRRDVKLADHKYFVDRLKRRLGKLWLANDTYGDMPWVDWFQIMFGQKGTLVDNMKSMLRWMKPASEGGCNSELDSSMF